MNIPGWLDTILMGIISILLLLASIGVSGPDVTAGLLQDIINNIFTFIPALVTAIRAIINSVRRWRFDGGLLIAGYKIISTK